MYPSQYKRYGIDTAIYTIDEFIEKFDEAIANNQKSVSEYIFETIEDYTKSETIKKDKYEGRTFTHIKPHHSYFGYFNQMIEAYSENDWGIMLGKRNGLNQSILLREIKIIVNRIKYLLILDLNTNHSNSRQKANNSRKIIGSDERGDVQTSSSD